MRSVFPGLHIDILFDIICQFSKLRSRKIHFSVSDKSVPHGIKQHYEIHSLAG